METKSFEVDGVELFTYEGKIRENGRNFFERCVVSKDWGSHKKGDRLDAITVNIELSVWKKRNTDVGYTLL